MDKDRVLEFLATNEEAKKWFQKKLDSHFSKGLETWKQNTLPKIIKEFEASKVDPHERRLSELQNSLETKRKIKALKLKTAETGLDKFIPSDAIVDVLATLEEEQANHTIELLNEHVTEIFNKMLTAEATSRFNDTTPRNEGQTVQQAGMFTKEQLLKMPYDERARLYQSNPDYYKQVMNN